MPRDPGMQFDECAATRRRGQRDAELRLASRPLNEQHQLSRRQEEATQAEPDKNLCRDLCAARIAKVIAGDEGDGPVPGDFAYLRTRRILGMTSSTRWMTARSGHSSTL